MAQHTMGGVREAIVSTSVVVGVVGQWCIVGLVRAAMILQW